MSHIAVSPSSGIRFITALLVCVLVAAGVATHAEARGTAETAGIAPPPATPIAATNLAAIVVHDRLTITLMWDDNVPTEDSWTAERSMAGPSGPWVTAANLPADTTQFDDTGLEDGVTYWYRVAANVTGAPPVYSNVVSGTASALPAPPAGDANCDGAVTSVDAALVLQYDAGLLAGLPCGDRGDANEDGAVDARDAQLILQFVAGLIARLPPPSGISGLVLIGPICPVEREDMPCPDQPFVAKIVIADDAEHLVRSVTSDALGRFHTELPPGSYVLQPQSPNPGAPPYAGEQTVIVEPFAFTEVLVQYDSGIR